MNSHEQYVLAIDVGTQSVRAIVFTRKGEQMASAKKISEPYYSLQPGWAEVPADQFWQDTCHVIREVVESLGDKINDVKAVAVTANRDNIIPLGEDDLPLRDWITWVDTRRAPEAKEALKKELKGLDLGVYLADYAFFSMIAFRSKFNWLKYNEPDTYHRAKKYVSITGYLNMKLCGVFKDARGMQVGYVPYQAKRQDWYKIKAVFKFLGVRREQLPDLVAPGEEIGRIAKQGHEATGLPVGLPVIASAGDKRCETLGSGVFDPSQATISYGTMATLGTTIMRHIEDKKLKFYTFASCVPDAWNPEYSIYRGYWLVSWFCRQYAKESGVPEFLNRMNQEVESVPAGSNGLFVFPFWTIHPGLCPHGKGMIAGWMDRHTEVDLYRAILESIAYALREGLELIVKKSKTRVNKLTVVGGGSQSDAAMQLTADIFNLPAVRLAGKEVSAVGAAINAGVWAGFYPNYEEGVRAMIREERTFWPNPTDVQVYERLYRDVYKKVYRNNEEVFKILEDFSGKNDD
ncbi:MAG TPA: FGGY-family carbohydrate kinase [Clostridia bacterium]|nr:FGGY-family carbohydrate kinase [Clostridia bacterium]